MCAYTEPNYYIGRNRIEIVNCWQNLGHIIDCQCNDSATFLNGHNSLVGQINVLCMFKSMSTVVKLKLMEAYCSSLCGSVLWNLKQDRPFMLLGIKASRWCLPCNAHWEILPVISNYLLIMDELCKRSIKFTNGCVVTKCTLVCQSWIGNIDISCVHTF